MLLNNYQIKLLAAILMLVDHTGAILLPDVEILRTIGRFSFPLFILLLVDGEKYTRNFSQYGLRLLLLGIVSQPIRGLLFNLSQWNILFTLLLGLVCLRLVRVFPAWRLLIWLVGGTIAQLLHLEYGAYGIVAISLIQTFRFSLTWLAGWVGLHLTVFILNPSFAVFQWAALFVPCLLLLANHQRGEKARWFYLFYPVHLLALWLLRQVLGGFLTAIANCVTISASVYFFDRF